MRAAAKSSGGLLILGALVALAWTLSRLYHWTKANSAAAGMSLMAMAAATLAACALIALGIWLMSRRSPDEARLAAQHACRQRR